MILFILVMENTGKGSVKCTIPPLFQSYFDIPNPARGEIVLKKVLDYETIQVLNVEVAAVVSLCDLVSRVYEIKPQEKNVAKNCYEIKCF